MERCVMFKNINQYLTGQHRIDHYTGPLILIQPDILFNDDERSGLGPAHLRCRLYDLIYRLVTEPLRHMVRIDRKQ